MRVCSCLTLLHLAGSLQSRCAPPSPLRLVLLPPPACLSSRITPRTHRMTCAAGRGPRSGAAAPAPTAAAAEAVDTLLSSFAHALPKLVVFDLDYTLWPFWCEMHSVSHNPTLYPHVPAILDGLARAGVQLAVASRTPTPHVANAFLDKLALRSRFCSIQLIPAADGFDHTTAQKDTAHLPAIRAETGHAWEAMLFFDDEHKNVARVSRLGVTSILVDTRSGVSLESLERGLRAFAEAHGGGGGGVRAGAGGCNAAPSCSNE